MSTKDRLLLDTDDDLTDRLFELASQQELLDREREIQGTDQSMQLELDRMQRNLDDQKKRIIRLKAQTAGL